MHHAFLWQQSNSVQPSTSFSSPFFMLHSTISLHMRLPQIAWQSSVTRSLLISPSVICLGKLTYGLCLAMVLNIVIQAFFVDPKGCRRPCLGPWECLQFYGSSSEAAKYAPFELQKQNLIERASSFVAHHRNFKMRPTTLGHAWSWHHQILYHSID